MAFLKILTCHYGETFEVLCVADVRNTCFNTLPRWPDDDVDAICYITVLFEMSLQLNA
jgi:hypothetical protein